MYKTVRHGENSLQYTILPQTEEVLNNSGIKGKGRDYSPSIHVRRSRRKSTVKYVSLILLGVVIALALASVPLYVMNGALYARRNHQDSHVITSAPMQITTAPLTPTGREIAKPRKSGLVSSDIVVILQPKLGTNSTTTSSSTSTTASPPAISDGATTPPWTMPALRSWKSSTPSTTARPAPTEDTRNIPLVGTPSGSIRLLDHYMSAKPWEDIIIRPTVTPKPSTIRNVFRDYSRLRPYDVSKKENPVTANKVLEDVLITTKATTVRTAVTTESTTTSERSKLKDLKDTILSVDDDEEFKESLEVDEVFSLPPLKPDSALPGTDSDEVTVSKTGGGWYGARWPFVDTSSYFQWTGYSPGDNLLLPLLVAALSSIALVLLLALAVKRRKRTHAASAQIGKLTAELQADDNTNLLTAENPEEPEE